MRICLVSTFPPTACGIATYCSYLVDGLLSADPNLAVTVLAEGPAFSGNADYVPAILHQVRADAPDVVHIQHEYGIYGFDNRFLRLLAALREIRVPTVVTLHTVHTGTSLGLGCCSRADRRLRTFVNIESYQRQLCALAGMTIVHQDWPMRAALVEQGVVADRVACIPHGTLQEPGMTGAGAKELLGYQPDTSLLVAFGYFEPSKNHQRLLEAFLLLRRRRPDAKLWIGGHVRLPSAPALEYKASIVALIDQLGLREHVTLCEEALPENQVPVLFSAADVGCFVYLEDTYSSSGALHRMLGTGKPMIASRIPKFHELWRIAPEILVDPDSPEEIASVLVRLLEDGAFRARIAARTLQFAAETSWPVLAKAHLDVYRRAAALVPAGLTAGIGWSQHAQAGSEYLR
jgi:glycosyltransferase involved in cell wall biosynthesis